jgi:hypothetical protein
VNGPHPPALARGLADVTVKDLSSSVHEEQSQLEESFGQVESRWRLSLQKNKQPRLKRSESNESSLNSFAFINSIVALGQSLATSFILHPLLDSSDCLDPIRDGPAMVAI